MPEYLAPGVYVEEIEIGAKPIEGVSTSTAGFLGETERGPTIARLVTSREQFRRIYGGYGWKTEEGKPSNSFLPYALEGFFANGGKRCFIGRIVGANCRTAGVVIEPPAGGPQAHSTSRKKSQGVSEVAAAEEPQPEAPESTSAPDGSDDPLFTVSALGPGSWGNRVVLDIGSASLVDRKPDLFKLVVRYWTKEPVDSGVPATVEEQYDNLSMDAANPDFLERRINGVSNLITVEADPAGGVKPPKTTEEGKSPSRLSDGSDGDNVTKKDYEGEPGGERTGLAAFETVDEIAIVCAPNENDVAGLTDALVTHCENMMDRFAVLQAPQSAGPVGKLLPPTDSKYAAFYYPWLKILDPVTNLPKQVPPGGHLIGIYARSDTQRGVHKAPANEPVRGALGLQLALTKGEQEILNPRGVNCIRAFAGRGIRVWGARTTSSDALWKYVNVRRLFLYLEESIDEGTQWVVFEPNDHRLWARVRQSVTDFLTRVWRDGALMGRKAEEAFFVKCDETTMTDDDIENGRLVVLVGVAPVRPAEFVIFRIAQWRSGSAISE